MAERVIRVGIAGQGRSGFDIHAHWLRESPEKYRIVAVADAYDAMRSTRTYRGLLSQEDAINELKQGSGTHFCPLCVGAFLLALESHGEFKADKEVKCAEIEREEDFFKLQPASNRIHVDTLSG